MKRALLLCLLLASAPHLAFTQGTMPAAREVILEHDFVPFP